MQKDADSPASESPRARLRSLLLHALSSDDPLLYDADGQPISRHSELWTQVVSQIIEQVVGRLPPNATVEELAAHLSNLNRVSPKYEFDIVDGKLLLPVHTNAGSTKFKAHIPVYKLLIAIVGSAAWYGFGNLSRFTRTSPFSKQKGGINKDLSVFLLGTWRSGTAVVCTFEIHNFSYNHYIVNVTALMATSHSGVLLGSPAQLSAQLPGKLDLPSVTTLAVAFNGVSENQILSIQLRGTISESEGTVASDFELTLVSEEDQRDDKKILLLLDEPEVARQIVTLVEGNLQGSRVHVIPPMGDPFAYILYPQDDPFRIVYEERFSIVILEWPPPTDHVRDIISRATLRDARLQVILLTTGSFSFTREFLNSFWPVDRYQPHWDLLLLHSIREALQRRERWLPV